MKNFYRFIFTTVSILLVGIFAFLYFSPVPITQWKAAHKAFSDFENNREIFINVAESAPTKNFFEVLLDIDLVHEVSVPDELTAIGIEYVYSSDNVVYFEYHDAIMGLTTFGILRTDDVSVLLEWYRTEQIEADWYYYRIVS